MISFYEVFDAEYLDLIRKNTYNKYRTLISQESREDRRGVSMIQRLRQAIHRHEQKEIELNRQDLLDLTDMTLEELRREHYSVSIRIQQGLFSPEGAKLLQERKDSLYRKIQLMRRLK